MFMVKILNGMRSDALLGVVNMDSYPGVRYRRRKDNPRRGCPHAQLSSQRSTGFV